MRRTLTLTTAAALLTLALAGCALPSTPATSSDGSGDQAAPTTPAADTPTSPAQKLSDTDGGTRTVDDYQAALDHFSAKCTQDQAHVAGIVYATQDDLQKNGVNDETEYTVMQHLDQSIPASMGKTDCTSIAAAYLVLRESKK